MPKNIKLSPLFHCSKLRLAAEHIEQRQKRGATLEEATNQTSIELARTADAHCRAFLVQSGCEMIEKGCATASPELAKVLRTIYHLYAYDEALKSLGDLLRVSRHTLLKASSGTLVPQICAN